MKRITSNLKHKGRIVGRKKPVQILEIGQGVFPCEATLYHKVEIFDILGAEFPLTAPIEVKFCTAKRTQVPVSPAKFEVNRCNESPLQGEKPDFGL